jgi:protein farnesyltransferase/geranylgeranyltransferase type-1 subunit alpha
MIDFTEEIWSDLTPILQDDGKTPLVPIFYTESYETAMKYCRALIKQKEYSPRALRVTEEILVENASHYSIWKYRLDILNKLGKEYLEQELIFLNLIGGDNPKSYQIWYC